jgi:putative DNA methylase
VTVTADRLTTTTKAARAPLPTLRSPLRHVDPPAISAAARAETRNREVHLPPVSVYRWWARRTDAVNGALVEAAAEGRTVPMLIADPFAGGGVIPLSAVTRGHRVYAQDLNPWAAGGLAAMLALPAPDDLREAVAALAQRATPLVAAAYGTLMADGTRGTVSHTFRVATSACTRCGEVNRHFPYAMVSLLARKERGLPDAILACRRGHLQQGRQDKTSRCRTCNVIIDPAAMYAPGRVVRCSKGHSESLSTRAAPAPWKWEVALVERANGFRRELGLPTDAEIATANSARWGESQSLGVIPGGAETRVLLRHGFRDWADLYPTRQAHTVRQLLDLLPECAPDIAVQAALRMAIIGSTEMAGHLSRWDRWYLKSYEAMAGHRFNLTTLAVEPNVWGTEVSGRGTVLRRLGHLVRAAEWLHGRTGGPLTVELLHGQSVDREAAGSQAVDVRVVEGSSEKMLLPSGSADLVLTDPPYHDDVQYSELSLPLRAWAGLADGVIAGEAVVNAATGQLTGVGEYQQLLTRIYSESRRVLKEDGHLLFSYANREPEAWVALLSALQDAGLRAAGYEIVHSENETDQVKRTVRACTMDLILDLVPMGGAPVRQHRSVRPPHDDETEFLHIVGQTLLAVGELKPGWDLAFVRAARASRFLSGR